MSRAVLALMLAVLMLNGCGKKPRHRDPPPLAPGDQADVYPRKYPPPDSPGEHL